LTMLGTVIGVTCVVALWNIGASGRAFMNDSLESLGQNLIFVAPNYNVDEGEQTRTRYKPLGMRDVVAIQNHCPDVEECSLVLLYQGNVSFGSRSHMTRVNGCYPSYVSIRKWKLESGVSFSLSDSRGRFRVALIGSY